MKKTIFFAVFILSQLCITANAEAQQPRSGKWRAPTDFGTLEFTVDSTSTKIKEIIFRFSNWTCYNVTWTGGSVSVTWLPGYGVAITNRQFMYETYIGVGRNQTMQVTGTFNQTGDNASGTWSSLTYGITCSGNWNGLTVGVEEICSGIDQFVVSQNFPNPFNPTTAIRYSIPRTEFVTLKVYNMLGSEVATLVNENLNGGDHSVDFNATGLSSGTYYYRLIAGKFVETKKMNLLK